MNQLPVTALASLAQQSPQPLLLDVREPWETALASIDLPGLTTLRIPMGELVRRAGQIPRSQPVVCICHHGVRSAQVVAWLERAGWQDVYNLSGGVDAWSVQVDAAVPRY